MGREFESHPCHKPFAASFLSECLQKRMETCSFFGPHVAHHPLNTQHHHHPPTPRRDLLEGGGLHAAGGLHHLQVWVRGLACRALGAQGAAPCFVGWEVGSPEAQETQETQTQETDARRWAGWIMSCLPSPAFAVSCRPASSRRTQSISGTRSASETPRHPGRQDFRRWSRRQMGFCGLVCCCCVCRRRRLISGRRAVRLCRSRLVC